MGRLFSGSNVPDLENALTVFELAELKGRGDVQAVVLIRVPTVGDDRGRSSIARSCLAVTLVSVIVVVTLAR